MRETVGNTFAPSVRPSKTRRVGIWMKEHPMPVVVTVIALGLGMLAWMNNARAPEPVPVVSLVSPITWSNELNQQEAAAHVEVGKHMLIEAFERSAAIQKALRSEISKVDTKVVALGTKLDAKDDWLTSQIKVLGDRPTSNPEEVLRLIRQEIPRIIKEVKDQIPLSELQSLQQNLSQQLGEQKVAQASFSTRLDDLVTKVATWVGPSSARAQSRPASDAVVQQRLTELNENCLAKNHPYFGRSNADATDGLTHITDREYRAMLAVCREERMAGSPVAPVADAPTVSDPPYRVVGGNPGRQGYSAGPRQPQLLGANACDPKKVPGGRTDCVCAANPENGRPAWACPRSRSGY